MSLYWESSYEIVMALMECFPETQIDGVGMEQLYRMIIELPDFADDPRLVNEGILRGILREWYEEASSE